MTLSVLFFLLFLLLHVLGGLAGLLDEVLDVLVGDLGLLAGHLLLLFFSHLVLLHCCQVLVLVHIVLLIVTVGRILDHVGVGARLHLGVLSSARHAVSGRRNALALFFEFEGCSLNGKQSSQIMQPPSRALSRERGFAVRGLTMYIALKYSAPYS